MPRLVFPSKNCTVPVAPAEDTVAVNVTLWPLTDGFRLEVRVVDVLALFTSCVSTPEVSDG